MILCHVEEVALGATDTLPIGGTEAGAALLVTRIADGIDVIGEP